MTNITLSIKNSTYKKMKKYSEIKWSEYVRKQIEKRIEELDSLQESHITTQLSEEILNSEWDNEEDERWNAYV
ncbi:MAG: hypothetical protein ACMXYB_00300 [Candidatus Woesearchaeota archaeon]